MVIAVSYGAGSAAFAALLVLVLLGRRAEGAGRHLVFACGVTLLWTCAAVVSGWRLAGTANILESVRTVSWLYFLGALFDTARGGTARTGSRRLLLVLPVATGILSIGNDVRFLDALGAADFDFSQILLRVTMAIFGILLVENLYRNTSAEERWHVVPLCIALGGLFAYDLFLYSDGLLFHSVDATLVAARGAVMALIVPPLALTLVRNRDWRIDVHVSRQFAFHTLTLLASGIFLLSAAAIALVLRRLPGNWGALLQVVFLSGSILVLITALSAGGFQSRIKGLVVRNLFSHRYDYRVEWMNFVDTVSGSDGAENLQMRVVRAIANIMDSPGGVLWLRKKGNSFAPAQSWNMHLERAHTEPASSAFISAFKEGVVVQELSASPDTVGSADGDRPLWARGEPRIWLAVPLQHRTRLFGFITLMPPRAPTSLNWESRDLLVAIGKQAASYLSEEQATRDLVDARLLTEFSRRFAFVAHDIKNLVSQLTMTIANAKTHGGDPEFREDMLHTLENSVSRMRELLSKLRPETALAQEKPRVDAHEVIASVVDEIGRRRVSLVTDGAIAAAPVAIEKSNLRSVLTHLVTNGLEASGENGAVTVRSRMLADHLVIEVRDDGPGMDEKFIEEQLFRPFHSTKSKGYGIGAFQAREMIREVGGDLEVVSSPGQGTTMRIRLPCKVEWPDAQRISVVGA